MRSSQIAPAKLALPLLLGLSFLIGCSSQPDAGPAAGQQPEAVDPPALLDYPQEAENGFSEIVYLGLDGNVKTIDRNGENRVPVTTRQGPLTVDTFRFSLPRFSPDGTKIAFMGHDRAGGENEIRNIIYVADARAKEIVPVHSSLANAPFYLDFSPTGESITFLSSLPDSAQLALQAVHTSGSNYRVLTDGRPLFYDWNPAGTAIVTHTGGSAVRSESSSGSIGIVRFSNGSHQTAVLDQVPTYFQVPALSPDGSTIAAAVVSPQGESSVSLFNTKGNHLEIVADLNGFAAIDWSPDGSRLAYIDGSNNPFTGIVGTLHVRDLRAIPQTVSMQSGTGSDTRVERVAAFFWSPDSEKIAMFRPIPVQGQTSGMNRYFRLTVLEVASGESTNYGVFPASMSFVTRVIPHFDQYQRSVQVWSPDSTHIVINSLGDNQRPGIYIIDLANRNEPQLIADGHMAFFAAEE